MLRLVDEQQMASVVGQARIERPLPKSKRDEVYKLIQKHGLDPNQFHWKSAFGTSQVSHNHIVVALLHPATGSYFIFDGTSDPHYAQQEANLRVGIGPFISVYSPGMGEPVEIRAVMTYYEQLQHCDRWLQEVKKEYDTPDFWDSLKREKTLPDAAPVQDDSEFTPEEKNQLSQALREIQRYLLTIAGIQEEQQQEVKKRFDYLESAIERLNRKDWVHTAIGVLFTIATWILDANTAREWFQFAGQQISDALGWVLQLP